MQEYTVSYSVEVDGDSPEEAARNAWNQMTDPDSAPPIFEVRPTSRPDVEPVKIELPDNQ